MNNSIIEKDFPESSLLKSISYDGFLKELNITFQDGKQAIYEEVPEDIVEELIVAESPGRYYLTNIKEEYHSTPFL